MNYRTTKASIDRFLRSTPWRALAAIMLLGMIVLVVRLIILAHYSLRYYAQLGASHDIQWLATLKEVHIWGIISGSLLLIILLAGFFDLLSFFFIAQRFTTITHVINRFAAGDLSQRVTIERHRSYPEIASLGRAFNQMADTIVSSLNERKRIEDLRRELVANVAHDLGTPVTSIQGFVETILLKEDTLSPQDRSAYLQIILSNTRVLSHLVSELTDLSRLDAPDTILAKEEFSVVALAKDIASRVLPLAEKNGISIDLQKPPHFPLAFADISMIERVLSNILENAVKYSREGGKITIEFAAANGKISVAIEDNGIGIPKEDLPHITERFYRVDKARERASGGSGLGLAIAKKVLDLHQCALEIQSEAGVGTRVRFELPLALEDVEVKGHLPLT